MCVILVCPEGVRPDPDTVAACHEINPHGIGLAWRSGGLVHWRKGLDPAGLLERLGDVPGEAVIHFRWASVGEVVPQLCHPFPVTAKAGTRLSGRARSLLFHNGTWPQWRSMLHRMPRSHRPAGHLSDTRVAASLLSLTGPTVLDELPGRWVVFGPGATSLHGDWTPWRGMQASNLHFLSFLRSRELLHQGTFTFPCFCGTPDT